MAVAREGTRPVMTGVYGLNWFPTGPRVLAEILSWMGFPEVRLAMLREGMPHGSASDGREDVGRMRVVAARQEGSLPGFADLDTPPSFNLMRDHEIVKGRRLPRRRG